MADYEISAVKKLDVNRFSEETVVADFEAEMLGPAKRIAAEKIGEALRGRDIRVRNFGDWVKDQKRGGLTREYMVSEADKPAKYIFILREK